MSRALLEEIAKSARHTLATIAFYAENVASLEARELAAGLIDYHVTKLLQMRATLLEAAPAMQPHNNAT